MQQTTNEVHVLESGRLLASSARSSQRQEVDGLQGGRLYLSSTADLLTCVRVGDDDDADERERERAAALEHVVLWTYVWTMKHQKIKLKTWF